MNIAKMAWRNVWRNRRRSLVCIIAMTFALTIMILYAGLVEGYLQGMERNILDMEVGDIQIHADDYLQKPDPYTIIEEDQALLAALDAKGIRASARLLGSALAGAGDASSGVVVRGVNVARDGKVFRIHEAINSGEWLDPADPEGLVLGRRLAHTLVVKPGDEVTLVGQALDGWPVDAVFHVRGVLQGVADATDRSSVFMVEATFRDFLRLEKGAHQIVVRRPEGMTLEETAAQVREVAPKNADVKTWKALMPTIAQMLESSRGLIFIIFFIIYIAVGILILNAMLMAVFERIREFGILKAIGESPLRVLGMILIESAIMIFTALVSGVLLSVPGMWYLSVKGIAVGKMGGMSISGVAMEPIWYGVYSAETLKAPIVALLVIAFLAVIYPAAKAALIKPVEAMRHH